MPQLSLRTDEELARRLRDRARAEGTSVNAWIVRVLRAATEPEPAGSEAERVRERLRLAGILAEPAGDPPDDPRDPRQVARARRAAGRGRPLSDLVSEGRD
jgi:plasmid stability protein